MTHKSGKSHHGKGGLKSVLHIDTGTHGRKVHIAIWSAILVLAMLQLAVLVEVKSVIRENENLQGIVETERARPIVLFQNTVDESTQAGDDLTPPLNGCTAEDRGASVGSFRCPTTATKWIFGTSPNLTCYKGPAEPVCDNDMVFSCNAGSCVCQAGQVLCDGVCRVPVETGMCGPGLVPNYCTGACESPL